MSSLILKVSVKMTARADTKEYSHFLVKWDSGDEPEYLVIPRSKILSEGRIKLQERYNTIWGDSTTDADDALVISTGDWLDMRKFLKTYQNAEQTHLTQSVQAVALHLNYMYIYLNLSGRKNNQLQQLPNQRNQMPKL